MATEAMIQVLMLRQFIELTLNNRDMDGIDEVVYLRNALAHCMEYTIKIEGELK